MAHTATFNIDVHKDEISHYNPEEKRSFEKRNKQLKDLFLACGHEIKGIKSISGVGIVMLEFTFGKHYSFRALSTKTYIILIDKHDYKTSNIKVQLVTDIDLNIKKIKPKINALIKSVKERLAGLVVRKEHDERDEALKNAIVEELGKGYNGWIHCGKNHDEIHIAYSKKIDEKESTGYGDEFNNRNISVRVHLKLNRWETEEQDYKIKCATTSVDICGNSSVCITDDVKFTDISAMQAVYATRLAKVRRRVDTLIEAAWVIKKAIHRQVREIDGYVIKQ